MERKYVSTCSLFNLICNDQVQVIRLNQDCVSYHSQPVQHCSALVCGPIRAGIRLFRISNLGGKNHCSLKGASLRPILNWNPKGKLAKGTRNDQIQIQTLWGTFPGQVWTFSKKRGGGADKNPNFLWNLFLLEMRLAKMFLKHAQRYRGEGGSRWFSKNLKSSCFLCLVASLMQHLNISIPNV